MNVCISHDLTTETILNAALRYAADGWPHASANEIARRARRWDARR
jgi:hypothetical protein